jgi:hypothetical protein
VTAPDAVSNGSAVGAFARSAGRVLLPLAVSAVVVLLLWVAFLQVFGIRRLIGKTPLDVWNWLVTDPKAAANRDVVFANLAVTFRDAGVGFVAGMTAAIVVAVLFVLFRSIEQTFLPVAMLLRSVPLVAMAPGDRADLRARPRGRRRDRRDRRVLPGAGQHRVRAPFRASPVT